MKQEDKPRHGSWGIQVVVILAFGLGLAVLGWFAAEEFGDQIESPVAATPMPAGQN